MSAQSVGETIAVKVGLFAVASAVASFPVLGVPVLALATGLVGGGISHLQREAKTDASAAKALGGILADAVIGGWIAVFLSRFTPALDYGMDNVPIEVLSGLLAWLMSAIRKNAGGYFDRAFQATLNAGVGLLGRFGGRKDE